MSEKRPPEEEAAKRAVERVSGFISCSFLSIVAACLPRDRPLCAGMLSSIETPYWIVWADDCRLPCSEYIHQM
jgi:hypothetical protein